MGKVWSEILMELTYEEKRILLINLIDWADNEPESLAADMLNDRRLQRKLMDFLGMKFITPPKKERQRREQARFSDIERKAYEVYEENLSEHQEIINEMIGDTGK
jgi:hypothetical protein